MGKPKTGGHCYRQRTTLKHHVLARDNRTCQLCGVPAQAIEDYLAGRPNNLFAVAI